MIWIILSAAASMMFLARYLSSRRTGTRRLLGYADGTPVEGKTASVVVKRRLRPGAAALQLVALPAKVLPDRVRSWLGRDLASRTRFASTGSDELLGMRVWFTFLFPFATLTGLRFSTAGFLLALPSAAAGASFPLLLAERRKAVYLEKIRGCLPYTTDMLYAYVLGGRNLDRALRAAAEDSPEPLRQHLLGTLEEIALGNTREESFSRLAAAVPVAELATLLRSLLEGERRGLPLAATLEVLSREIRLKRRDRLREAVARTPLKILAPLVFMILPASVLLTVGPTFISALQRGFH